MNEQPDQLVTRISRTLQLSNSPTLRANIAMSWLFGKGKAPPVAPPAPPPPPPKTLAQEIKENKRKIDRACRELDRERMKMEQQEKRVKAEIRKVAKEGQVDAARILAKDLARTRTHVKKMYQMRTQMQSIGMQMSSMQTQQAMTSAMGNVVGMMAKMNAQMNLPQMQKMMMQFEMEQGKMEVQSDMMDDAMDNMNGVEESEEADRILEEVLAEAGMADLDKLGGAAAPVGAPGAQASDTYAAPDMSEIDARINNLNR